MTQGNVRYDVLIIGGGPAGLSAALMLGRACRRALVIDDGRPRNSASHAMHGFLSRDGIPPREFLRISREQLAQYGTIHLLDGRVTDGSRTEEGFEVMTADGRRFYGRKVIIATGVTDDLPGIDGLCDLYGRSVFHCPYCDGWEVRDQPLAVVGRDEEHGGGLALELLCWSRDVVLCSNGPAALGRDWRERLLRHGVSVREEPILRLEGRDGILERIVFTDGPPLARRALFFWSSRRQSSDLPKRLGCDPYDAEGCHMDKFGRGNVPGLYVIGDASRDILQVIVGAGEGSEAAIMVNAELIKEDFG